MKKLIALFLLTLTGCRFDIPHAYAEEETYVTHQWGKEGKWDYAARVLPVELMSEIRSEILRGNLTYPVDPDRFSAIALTHPQHQTLYLFTRQIHCVDQTDCQRYEEKWQTFYPACVSRAGCNYEVYVKEGQEYRLLFPFAVFGYPEPDLFQVSTQKTEQGYPKCFRIDGYDGDLQFRDHPLHQEYDPEQPLLTTYCYDPSQSWLENQHHYHLKDVTKISPDFQPSN